MATSKKTPAKTPSLLKSKAAVMPAAKTAAPAAKKAAAKTAKDALEQGVKHGATGLPTTTDGTTAVNEDSAHPHSVQAGQPELQPGVIVPTTTSTAKPIKA